MKIGILTSGGDAPGMNAAVRAAVRATIFHNGEPYGIYNGYDGLVHDNIELMTSSSVSNTIHRGGTFLRTARSKDFLSVEGRAKAYETIKRYGLDGLVVIGGDGTFRGAIDLCREYSDVSVVGVPGTIDNDLYGTDYTIGYDTAVNTVVEAVDKIRDTATAHNRLFFVEVMGRDAGFIALRSAVASGAEAALVPEVKTDFSTLDRYLDEEYHHKRSGIVIVAEGEKSGGAYAIAENFRQKHPDYDVKVSSLGYIQRGGSPSAYDRVMASTLGVAAVESLMESGNSGVMVGIMDRRTVTIPLTDAVTIRKPLNATLLHLMEVLSI